MKHSLKSVALGFLIPFMNVSAGYAQDYDAGLEAYKSGDYAKALKEWRPLAEQGDTRAQANLATMYSIGNPAYDVAAADSWYRKVDVAALTKLANAGDPLSQFNLGVMYLWGGGKLVAQDSAAAASWFQRAADQGLADAQNELGELYRSGWSVQKNDEIAVSWFRRAADQGYAKAQLNLGHSYFAGKGVNKDFAAAVRWYRRAADQGQEIARGALSEILPQKKFTEAPKKDNYYKGYKIIGSGDKFINSCMDLIIRNYNIIYKNKYGKLVNHRKLFYIQINGPSQNSFRNGAPFRVQSYTVGYIPNGENIVADVIYCESKNGIAFGLENSLF